MGNFGYIGIFFIAAFAFAATLILIPLSLRLLRVIPRKPNTKKYETFECGMETTGTSLPRFNFRYYFFALLFVIFDIQVVFLYPWAVEFKSLYASYGIFAFMPMFIFLVVLELGFVYVYMKGGLKWD